MNKSGKPIAGKLTKPKNKPGNASTRDKQRGFGVVELLFAAATLSATVLVAAMNSSKRPPLQGN